MKISSNINLFFSINKTEAGPEFFQKKLLRSNSNLKNNGVMKKTTEYYSSFFISRLISGRGFDKKTENILIKWKRLNVKLKGKMGALVIG
ncbi:MAG: hypothetical protein JXR95_11955 [Deltaproteobacteria bacterium]|nr:hypothetical protein [Deltaproteobacteria bacterium]